MPELDRIHARMLQLGWPTLIAQGLRTIHDQIQLYAKGRTFDDFRDHLEGAVAKGSLAADIGDRWIGYFDPAQGATRCHPENRAP